MGAYLSMVALQGRANNGGRGQYIDLALYEPLFTLMGPHAVNFDQLGIVQERTGSLHNFTSPRNCYRTRDGRYVAIAGAAQSTFERMCEALEIPHVIQMDPRFLDNRLRLDQRPGARRGDGRMRSASFDYDDLLARFLEVDATVAPVNDIAQIFADPQFQARENIVTVEDPELGGPVRFQNVVGKLSDTPGRVADGRAEAGRPQPRGADRRARLHRGRGPRRRPEDLTGENRHAAHPRADDRRRRGRARRAPELPSLGRHRRQGGDGRPAFSDGSSRHRGDELRASARHSEPEGRRGGVRAHPRRPGVVYRGLVPNARGAERALPCKLDELLGLITVSEAYNKKNQNMTLDQGVDGGDRDLPRRRQGRHSVPAGAGHVVLVRL